MTLEIRNALGVVVDVLVNEMQAAGRHTLKFEANILPQGVYTASIRLTGKNDDLFRTIKMVLNK